MAAVFLCAPVNRKPTVIRVQQFESVKKKNPRRIGEGVYGGLSRCVKEKLLFWSA